jgi:tetratricopeptide (TPR) repeat protein
MGFPFPRHRAAAMLLALGFVLFSTTAAAQDSLGLGALRDAVYDSAPLGEIEAAARNAQAQAPGGPAKELHLSAIEYFLARGYNENGDKKKAIPRFEAAIAAADRYLAGAENPPVPGLLAKAKALSELAILKDVVFLVANGPKVPSLAKKILELDPANTGALLITASSKAYPPRVFGGDPKEAIRLAKEIAASRPGGLAKDELFDLRACVGTAYEKSGDKDRALAWFAAALELYPHNRYASERLGTLKK